MARPGRGRYRGSRRRWPGRELDSLPGSRPRRRPWPPAVTWRTMRFAARPPSWWEPLYRPRPGLCPGRAARARRRTRCVAGVPTANWDRAPRGLPCESPREARARRLLRPAGGVGVRGPCLPHTHEYTARSPSPAPRASDGTIRLAATGLAGTGARLRSAEAAAGGTSRRPGKAAVSDVTLADDALASSWYREQTLPVLCPSCLTQLDDEPHGAPSHMTIQEPPARACSDVLRARDHRARGPAASRRLRCLHRPRRR